MKHLALSQTSFDEFLTLLDPDRDVAGQKYEWLRCRIVKFFEWRACRSAEELADETLDRMMRKIQAGIEIKDHVNYAYGVARLVYLEAWKEQSKMQAVVVEMPVKHEPVEADRDDQRLDCLEQCLDKLSSSNRSMILQYYRDDKQAKIDRRKLLAERNNISINALRIKALRLRSKLEACVRDCMDKNDA